MEFSSWVGWAVATSSLFDSLEYTLRTICNPYHMTNGTQVYCIPVGAYFPSYLQPKMTENTFPTSPRYTDSITSGCVAAGTAC